MVDKDFSLFDSEESDVEAHPRLELDNMMPPPTIIMFPVLPHRRMCRRRLRRSKLLPVSDSSSILDHGILALIRSYTGRT
eukprot:42738-Eustigmatos_ZCMA.PRE.1